jgi:GH15 family glucan-1,4-alpha-glucosidase
MPPVLSTHSVPSPAPAPGARGYVPIGDYAAIGDGRTAALVARDGSIDWLCLPELDSPSVFAAALDADRGGRFALEPEIEAKVARRYLPDTNVFEATFTTRVGVVRVTDAMALPDAELGPTRELIRRVDGLRGQVPMKWRITPAFGYGTRAPQLESRGGTPVATDGRDALAVCSWDAGEAHIDEEAMFGRFEAREGSSVLIALCAAHQEPLVFPRREDVNARLEATTTYWRRWAGQRAYWSVARFSDPQRAGAQAASSRSVRGDRGGGERLPAGGDRRRAQLGLPLLLGT